LSLQGTLDTFSLPEILGLVERSRKTGALEVRDPQSRGVLYFTGGRFSAAEAGDLSGPVESAEELEARVIDVCFALFRVETGLFDLETDRFPPWPVRGGIEITPTIEQVQQLRRDWLAIEAVIPSLDCRPSVVEDLGGDRVVLDKAGFRVLRVVDGRRTVRGIAREAGRSVLEVCKVLRELVESGAVGVPAGPERTVVDELVLATDAEPVAEPAPVAVAQADRTARAARGEDRCPAPPDLPDLPDLPQMAGVVVPSSPEGLEPDREPDPEPVPAAPPARVPDPGIEVGEEPAAPPTVDRAGEQPAFEPLAVEPVAVEPVAVEPVAVEPVAAEPGAGLDDTAADDDDEPPPDRGALLRLFSSLRDG
jgi:hypothetical protein